jgi:hypothetical protein
MPQGDLKSIVSGQITPDQVEGRVHGFTIAITWDAIRLDPLEGDLGLFLHWQRG